MAVVEPWLHLSPSEYKKQREEARGRRRSWLQRVMGWDKRDGNEEGPRQDTEDDESDDVSEEEEETQDERSARNGKIVRKRGRRQGFVECGHATTDKTGHKWENDEGEEVEIDSDVEIQENRLELSRKNVRKRHERQGFVECGHATTDKMWYKGENDEGEEVERDSDVEIQENRLERSRKIMKKQRESPNLEKNVQAKKEVDSVSNEDDTLEQNGTMLEKQRESQHLEEYLEAKLVYNWQEADSETPAQELDNTESVCQENQKASASHGHDFDGENLSESTEFGHDSDSLSFSKDGEFKRPQAEEQSDDIDAVTNELDESGLALAMGGADEVANQSMDNFLFDIHTEENNSSGKGRLRENGQSEENGGKLFQQHLEVHSSGQSLASGISENDDLHNEGPYDLDTEENKDVEVGRFEHFTEDGEAKTSTQGEVEEPKDDSDFDHWDDNSASGISENWELYYEGPYNLDTDEASDVEVDGFETLSGAKRQEVDELATEPNDPWEFDHSDQNSASTCFGYSSDFYEEGSCQDTAEDRHLDVNGFDTENGSESGEFDYKESCNQNSEKDAEVNGFEVSTEDDGVKTSTQGTAQGLPDGPLTEEETTTTDEDEDIVGDEVTDCYDLNEIKHYRRNDHTGDIFQTLSDFKDSQILTDLELKTSDGKSIHVHAVVFSAVSHIARSILNKQPTWFWNRKALLMEVGPEVEHRALEAVVEFAYTGAIRCLNALNVDEIKAAARYLSASRITEICDRELSKHPGKTKEKHVPASAELRTNLQNIEELWTKKMGCDVTLDVISASFQVHKVILAACSDYFRAMFTLGMKESSQSSVYLKFLSASDLEALLDFSYTGAIALSWNSIFEITSTALQIQYQPALDLCLSFLHREINPHSCLDVASFAEAFGIDKLLDHAEDYVLRQFQKVSRTPKFKDLPARNLLKYLNSFALCVPSELVVFRAVVDWIQAKPKRRLKLAKELMKTIHFPLMTFKEFKEVQTLNMWSNHSLKELYAAIFEDFCSNEIEMQNKCRIYLPKESLVLSGGEQILEDLGTRSVSNDLWFGNSLRNHTGIKKAMEWRHLGEMPQVARFSHEVAVIQGKLYIVGGKKYYGTGDTLTSFFRYDPLENAWEELSPMLQARSSFSLVVLESKLYALGGQSHHDYLETVEQYCPTANSWSFTRPLDLPLGAHVARVFAGQIFISGGLNDDYRCLSTMMAYHPERGCAYLENMTRPRALHCMEVLGDFLYVAGGFSQTDGGEICDMLACEVYNPEADSWTCFPSLPVPHVGAGSTVLEGKFYVLGGYSQENYNDVRMVHRYDPATQRWENMGKMPGPNNDLRACVLGLPEHLRLCPDER
ncbi:uncharacterized protein [Eucyclogobius newberryi]|uniref:uncharacterized protein n=1 Tax=Eucyclogobius newberryi TaxID=166745 RepID=UPI003B5B9497